MEVGLKSFLSGGKFGDIDLGQRKKEIEPIFDGKIDWLKNETKESSRIWKVDSFEFHFEDQVLVGIFNDHISEISHGDVISIKEKWIFNEKNITLDILENNLANLNIYYRKTEDEISLIHVRLENDVYFTFEKVRDENYELVVFGKTKVQKNDHIQNNENKFKETQTSENFRE